MVGGRAWQKENKKYKHLEEKKHMVSGSAGQKEGKNINI